MDLTSEPWKDGPVLIVDDEALIVDEVMDALELEGVACVSAHDVDSALAVLASRKDIRLVVTDLKMPGKSGWDLIALADCQALSAVRFLVTSGHAAYEVENADLPPQVVGFMRKPMDVNDLLSRIQGHLRC